jgi:hypothetical protein
VSKGNDKKAKARTSDNSMSKSGADPKPANTPSEGASKLEGNAPSNYSRGEKQKLVTDSYRNNWNRIFGKKRTKR